MVLIFIWGGLEKYILGFLDESGLEVASGFVSQVFELEETLTTVMAVVLDIVELAAGLLVVFGKKIFEA